MFALGSTNSTLVQAIVGPVAGSSFGQSVGLSTSYIIVGAPSAANGGEKRKCNIIIFLLISAPFCLGMVYIYTANVNVKGSYTLQAALTNPNILYTTYGLSVAIASRTAVVGANGAGIEFMRLLFYHIYMIYLLYRSLCVRINQRRLDTA